MAQVPGYYDVGSKPTIGSPTQARPVDASGVLEMLRTWHTTNTKRLVDQAEVRAAQLGAVEGARAQKTGLGMPGADETTAAGSAYAKAAKTAYWARTELDLAQGADELALAWERGDYGEDIAKWSQAADQVASKSLKGLRPEDAAVFAPRAQEIIRRTKSKVSEAHMARVQERDRATIIKAVIRLDEDAQRQAMDGDVEALLATQERMASLLDGGYEGRVLSAEEHRETVEKHQRRVRRAAVLGDFRDAPDKAQWLKDFDANPPEMLSVEEREKVRDQAQEWYREGREAEVKAQAQEALDRIVAAGGDLKAWRTAAKSVEDAEVREKVVSLVEHEWTVQQAQAEQAKKDALHEARILVEETKSTDGIPKEIRKLIPEHLDGLEKRARDLQAGREPTTDFRLLATLSAESAKNPEAYLKRDLYEYRDRLDDADFQRVLSWGHSAEAELRRRGETAEAKAEAKAVVEQERRERATRAQVDDVVKATAKAMGLNPNAKVGTDEAMRYNALYERAFRWADEFKPQSRQEIQDYSDQELLLGDVTTPWWAAAVPFYGDEEAYLFEVGPENAERFEVDGVPGEALPDVIDALKQSGQRITRENVKKLYRAGQKKAKEADGGQ